MANTSSTLETLARLSSKPGVQSTLILSRDDGAIIQSSGFPSPKSNATAIESSGDLISSTHEDGNGLAQNALQPKLVEQGTTTEEIARAIFNYVSETAKLIDITGSGDEVQLLRLRTKKQEIVIVPDQRYLMVVIQEAPKTA